MFHVSRLRRYEPNDEVVFPNRDTKAYYDTGNPEKDECIVEAILGHRWVRKKPQFLVRWTVGEDTWEPLSHVNECSELDAYLALHGVDEVDELGHKEFITADYVDKIAS